MKPATLTSLAAFIAIGAVGFIAGRISSSDPAAQETRAPAEIPTRPARANGPTESSGSIAERMNRDPGRRGPASASISSQTLDQLTSIVRGEDALDRNRALLAYIDRLGPADFEQAIDRFRSLGITESRMGEYAQLLSAWAKVDPNGALAYAEANTRGGFAANTILTTWAASQPDAAIQWAQTHHEGDGANPYLPGIIRGLAANDPQRAYELLTSMPRSIERGEGLDAIMPHVLAQGAEATRQWIASLNDESLRNGAMMRSAEALAAEDPAGTANLLLANPSEATRRRMDDVYRVWARQDQAAAIQAFSALPAGEERTNALRGVVNAMASSDPQAAVAMLDQYPNDVNDRMVQNVIWHSFGSDPALALSQIPRMTDGGNRNQAYTRMLNAWRQRDPAAANAWIQRNPLPPAVLERLNQP